MKLERTLYNPRKKSLICGLVVRVWLGKVGMIQVHGSLGDGGDLLLSGVLSWMGVSCLGRSRKGSEGRRCCFITDVFVLRFHARREVELFRVSGLRSEGRTGAHTHHAITSLNHQTWRKR